jgi:hypothetical protein
MTLKARADRCRADFRPREFAFDEAILREMRHVRRLSFAQIARRFGCDHATVIWAFHRLGIPTQRPLQGADENRGQWQGK